MKQTFTLIFFIFLAGLKAQTITQAFNEPVIGDIDKNYRLDTSAYTSGMPITTTGSNCAWNYSNLTGIFPMVVDSFIAPSAAVGATANPGASYAQHRDLLYTFYKSTTSPQQTELLGAYSPSLSLTFTNSAIIATYPVSYGYNLTDPVSGSFKYNTTTGACNGSITISADGLGTIQMPGAVSISNVLCLRSVEILTLSAGILPVGTFNQSIYNYYMPGRKFPILSINYTTYQLIAGTPTTTAYVYGSNNYYTVTGLKESTLAKKDPDVYPNPFHDLLFVRTENPAEETDYTFYDAKGQVALKTKALSGPATEQLAPGVYFLEMKNKSGTSHQKIIKE